jgi:hypothetical protein
MTYGESDMFLKEQIPQPRAVEVHRTTKVRCTYFKRIIPHHRCAIGYRPGVSRADQYSVLGADSA